MWLYARGRCVHQAAGRGEHAFMAFTIDIDGGNDSVFIAGSTATINGLSTNAGTADYVVSTDGGNDSVFISSAAVTLDAGAGDDSVHALDGTTVSILGGKGDDTIAAD